jgi:hypothetical protein
MTAAEWYWGSCHTATISRLFTWNRSDVRSLDQRFWYPDADSKPVDGIFGSTDRIPHDANHSSSHARSDHRITRHAAGELHSAGFNRCEPITGSAPLRSLLPSWSRWTELRFLVLPPPEQCPALLHVLRIQGSDRVMAVAAFVVYLPAYAKRHDETPSRDGWRKTLLLCGVATGVFAAANMYFIQAAGLRIWL